MIHTKENLQKDIDLLDIELSVLDDKMRQLMREKRMHELALQDTRAVLQRSQSDFDKAFKKQLELISKKNKLCQ